MTTTQAFALALAGALALPGIGLADPVDYPHKVVTLVTHSSPGGGSDVFLREHDANIWASIIDATFVVENVTGGSGAKAMARAGHSAGRRQHLLRHHADLHLHLAAQQARAQLRGRWSRW